MSDKAAISVKQVSTLLEVSPSKVYRMIKNDEIPAFKNKSGEYRIYRQDLTDHIERHIELRKEQIKSINPDCSRPNAKTLNENIEKPDNDEHAVNLSRRRFLSKVGSFVLSSPFISASVAAFTGSVSSTLIYNHFAESISLQKQQQNLDKKRIELVTRLFGGFHNLSWSASLNHLVESYNIRQNFNKSSTFIASTSLGAVFDLSHDGWVKNAIKTKNLPGPILIDTDIVAIGSPINDDISRLSLEYNGKSRYELNRSLEPLLDLPITYAINKHDVRHDIVQAKRFVAGEEREMPNWTIHLDNDFLPSPKLNGNRWLKTDYLLISRIPNLLCGVAFYSGAEILIVGGTHGVGTEAIALVLNDYEVLNKIDSALSDSRYFQVIIPVDEIDHCLERGTMRSIPLSIGEPIVRRVVVDRDRILANKIKTWK